MVTSHHSECLHADAVAQSICAWTYFFGVGKEVEKSMVGLQPSDVSDAVVPPETRLGWRAH